MFYFHFILVGCVLFCGCAKVEPALPPTREKEKLSLPVLTIHNNGQPTSVSWPKELKLPAGRELEIELPITVLGEVTDFHVGLEIRNRDNFVVQSTTGTFIFADKKNDSPVVSMRLGKVPNGNYRYKVSIFNSEHGVVSSEGDVTSK